MFQKEVVFYLGKEKDNGFSGFLSEDNFFLILEVEEGLTAERGREIIKSIKETL